MIILQQNLLKKLILLFFLIFIMIILWNARPFQYCIEKDIKIKWFLHTLAEHVLQIYNKIITSKKVENAAIDFFKYLEDLDRNIKGDISVNITVQ